MKAMVLAAGIGVSLLSSVIPYTFEMEALRSMPKAVFGTLMSLEPGIAALAGLVILGQALSTPHGWKILDFEGEPGGELDARRVLDHPMRDVAGMLRSYAYAAWQGGGNSDAAIAWGADCRAAFLSGYAASGDIDPADHEVLLTAYTIDKAAYEAVYEQRNRPDWIEIPLTALRVIAAD